MDIKLVILFKSGGVMVKDIHTTPERVKEDIKFVDDLLDNILDAMTIGSIIRFKDDRVRDIVINCKSVCGVQYYIAANDSEYEELSNVEITKDTVETEEENDG